MRIKNYQNFIKENFKASITFDEYWDYGNLIATIHFDMSSFKNWLNSYGDFDVTDEISKDIKLPVGCLKNINVNDEYKNKGYGNKILNYFIDECIENDVKNIILIADKDEKQVQGFDLEKWYESKGFEVVDYIYNNPVMILEL